MKAIKILGVLVIVSLMLFCLSVQVFGKARPYKPLRCHTFRSNCQGTVKQAQHTFALWKHRKQYQKRSY